ncbi:MAG: hypothetical protein PQJ61_07695 [Spirochaetales bacterium]|uniref:Uncharacterized protein n=1 Tax=Candidatus Thalassospirochaeta sargassi TaxID=3119039 RepID=A0AAJ1ICA1_9SPIO|nr:hypothetical protein [Spirochaetales bacterium]
MKIEESALELMKRYLKAVERYLPISKRADISREIESMIYDICEERYTEIEVDKQKMESVLVELGKPSKLAAKYKETRPLIGPELTPIFKLVVSVIVLITGFVSLINFAFAASSMTGPETGLYFLDLFGSVTGIVGTVFIVFYILERAIRNKSEIDFDDETWKIKDLPEIKDKTPGRSEVIAVLIFSVIIILALNLFTDRVGIYEFHDGGYNFTPILAADIYRILPLFSLRIAIGAVVGLPFIAGNGAVTGGSKNYYWRISQIGLNVFDIGIIILLFSRGFNSFFLSEGFSNAGFPGFVPVAEKLYVGILLILLVRCIITLVRNTLVILPKGRV